MQVGEIDRAIEEAVEKHSAAIDLVSDDDREWFAANPGRTYRLRVSADAELAVRLCERPAENSGFTAYTLIRQIRHGVRMRLPFQTHTLHRPEHFSDNAYQVLISELRKEYPEIAKALDSMAALDAALSGRR